MQKLYKNCQNMDQRCYDEYGLSEDILMEHAAQGMADYINQNFYEGTILIVCGIGNNGADGLALSRLLHHRFESIKVYLPFGTQSLMAKKQLVRINKLDYVTIVDELSPADIVVDALFGAGLNRPLSEKYQNIIMQMNQLGGFKIACDVPSGLDEDGVIFSEIFDADVTLTMGARKEALYSDFAKDYVGRVYRLDLGVHYASYTKDEPVSSYLLNPDDLNLPSRDFSKVTHKGDFGHVAVFCGEKEGAGIIAAMASSRFGAGLTTLVTQKEIVPPPYLMHSTSLPEKSTALAVGMGLGLSFDSAYLKQNVLNNTLPIVLDADALYYADLLEVLEQKNREIVVTPHPKEFSAMWKILSGEEIDIEEIQERRFEMVRKFNRQYPHVTIILKGANMIISEHEKLYINPHGSSKLSKGGTGDVLSGLIVSLLAQGYTAIDAAIHATLALTLASASHTMSAYALLPTDLIESVGQLNQENLDQEIAQKPPYIYFGSGKTE